MSSIKPSAQSAGILMMLIIGLPGQPPHITIVIMNETTSETTNIKIRRVVVVMSLSSIHCNALATHQTGKLWKAMSIKSSAKVI